MRRCCSPGLGCTLFRDPARRTARLALIRRKWARTHPQAADLLIIGPIGARRSQFDQLTAAIWGQKALCFQQLVKYLQKSAYSYCNHLAAVRGCLC